MSTRSAAAMQNGMAALHGIVNHPSPLQLSMNPTFWTAVRRGLSRRCPRCGEGKLFRRWISAYQRCSACGLEFQSNHGNTWMFIVITDRIPLLFGIGALFLGLRPHGVLQNSAFLFLLAVPLIVTMPHRQGMAMALDYVLGRSMSGGDLID